MSNPTVEEALTVVNETAIDACPLPFTDAARQVIPDRFRVPFGQRLATPNIWRRDRHNVLNAAKQLGVVAAAVASLRQKEAVDVEHINTAAALVVEQCELGFKEGIWCS